jgi:sporulation protein YlmC with PRC-barrel domain
MNALLQISLGAEVNATDGLLGKVRAVIIDPVSGKVTHLAVTNLGVPNSARLITPSHVVHSDRRHAQLDLTRREALACPRLVVPGTVPDADHHGRDEDVSAWFAPMNLLSGTYTFALQRRLPSADSVLLARGKAVETAAGVHLGVIDDVIIDAATATVSQLSLTEGHFLGRRQVLIPAALIREVGPDRVRVDLTEAGLPQQEPPAHLDHPTTSVPSGDDDVADTHRAGR